MDSKKKTGKTTPANESAGTPAVQWDDSAMQTSYANVCNVSSTREEVTLLFGTNQTWHTGQDVSVRLSNRLILSPFAARRLASLLANVVTQYEERFGPLGQDLRPVGGTK